VIDNGCKHYRISIEMSNGISDGQLTAYPAGFEHGQGNRAWTSGSGGTPRNKSEHPEKQEKKLGIPYEKRDRI